MDPKKLINKAIHKIDEASKPKPKPVLRDTKAPSSKITDAFKPGNNGPKIG